MILRILSAFLSALLCAFFLLSCSALKAAPAADSGFLKHSERLKHNEKLPFHAAWRNPDLVKSDYDSLYISPVNLDFLFKTSDWSTISVFSDEEIRQEASILAQYFRDELRGELEASELKLVKEPGKRTVHLEVAIVELVPTDVVRNAAGSAAGFFVPGGGLVSAGAGGSIAIEARYVHPETGTELALFKDREQAKISPIDLAGLTAFRHAENSIDDWVEQLAEIMTTPEGTPVSDSSPFRLSPW